METHLCLTSIQWEPFLKYPGECSYGSYNYHHYQGNDTVNQGLFLFSRSIVWSEFFCLSPCQTLCKFIGHQGGGTKKMPEGAICQVDIPVTAPCHSTGHHHWTHCIRRLTRQENTKFQQARVLVRVLWSSSDRSSLFFSYITRQIHSMLLMMLLILIIWARQCQCATIKSFPNWSKFL